MEINPSLDKESIKKDKELYKKINRSKNIQMQLSSRRTITNPPLLKNPGSGVRYKYKRHSLPSDINNYSFENIDSIKVIDKIIA